MPHTHPLYKQMFTCGDATELRAEEHHYRGTVLFDGDLDAPGARDKLPTIVKEKLEKMEAADVKPPKAIGPTGEKPLLPTDDSTGL